MGLTLSYQPLLHNCMNHFENSNYLFYNLLGSLVESSGLALLEFLKPFAFKNIKTEIQNLFPIKSYSNVFF